MERKPSKIHILPIFTLSLLWLLIPLAVVQAATYYLDFENPLSNEWEMVGEAEIISDNPQSGQYCLKLGAMGRATLPVSDNNVYGKVSFWVKDSMVEFPSSDVASIGPVFGLQNKDGNMLLFGILRRDYLNGTKYGYLLTAENNFYTLHNLGVYPYVNRTGEWQKWTIEVSGPGVINVYVNDELKTISDSLKQYFSKGFTEVYFRGDNSVGPEEFHFDDVTVEVSGEGQTDLHEFPEPRAITNVLQDPNFFPIAVWAQALDFMDYFKALGVNMFIGEGAKGVAQKEFLDSLYSKGLYGIVRPGEYGKVDPQIISQFKNHPALLAWRHIDEPDVLSKDRVNLKSPPWEIKQLYDEIGALDLEHSVYLNFGPGVGGDPTRRHAQITDYYEYCEGADIISYDIYPISTYANGEKLLYSVADGIDSLKDLSNNKKPIWIWLEARTGDLDRGHRSPTPQEMRAEVWMTIIHGADGIGWFVAEFDPFQWHDIPPELEVEMTNIAQTLKALAPAINSSERDDVRVRMLTQGRIDVSSRIHDNKLYFFAVNMMNKNVEGELILPDLHSNSRFKEIYEDRTIQASGGSFTEKFGPYEVHLYEEISFDKDIELTIRFDKKKVSETDVLFISGNTEEGAVIEEVKLLDENNNVLNVNVKDKISIDDKRNITGQVAVTDIIEKYPLVRGIKIRMKVRKGDRTGEGETGIARIEPFRAGPDRIGVYNNVFNPIEGEKAIIMVETEEQGYLRIGLYNTKGNKIRELVDEEKEADIHKYYWDGRNESGNVVGCGLYFVHIQAGDYKKTKKIVVVK